MTFRISSSFRVMVFRHRLTVIFGNGFKAFIRFTLVPVLFLASLENIMVSPRVIKRRRVAVFVPCFLATPDLVIVIPPCSVFAGNPVVRARCAKPSLDDSISYYLIRPTSGDDGREGVVTVTTSLWGLCGDSVTVSV